MSDKSINQALVNLIEGIPVRMWRDQNGDRLKDTGEWVDFYLSTKDNTRTDDWISCDERLPEDGIDVLVYSCGVVSTAKFWELTSKWLGCDLRLKNGAEITHWQPLPTAPTK